MTTILNEIPGALERPGSCRIVVTQQEEGAVTIAIPPRRGSPVVWIAAGILLFNLLLILYCGAMLFFAHRVVLILRQILPYGVPVALGRFGGWFALGGIALEGLGFWILSLMVRPLFTRERLTISPAEIVTERRAFGRTERQAMARRDARGFHLQRDPQGFAASALTVQGRGQEILVAEHVEEGDREWLASVGNALLRQE